MRIRPIAVCLPALVALLAGGGLAAQETRSSSQAIKPQAAKASPGKGSKLDELLGGPIKEGVAGEVQALRREYMLAMFAWHRKQRDAAAAQGKPVTSISLMAPDSVVAEFAPRFMKAAEKYAGSDDALPFLEWCLFTDSRPQNPTTKAALKVVLQKNLDCAGLAKTLAEFSRLKGKLGGDYTRILGQIIEKTKIDEVRAAAHFARAEGTMKTRVPRDQGDDAAQKAYRAQREAAIADYQTAIRLAPKAAFADSARGVLFKLNKLQIGMKAPDIVGKDLQGQPIKLSDFTGKVVLLSFWATWCGPCMAMIPHERELVARYAGEPFALVGVNGDEEPAAAHAIAKAKGVTWRSFWNGPKAGLGAISTQWDVRGWPTFIIIDHQGIIRARGNTVDDELLGKLVKAAKQR